MKNAYKFLILVVIFSSLYCFFPSQKDGEKQVSKALEVTARKPVDIMLVIDRSATMGNDSKLAIARSSASYFVDKVTLFPPDGIYASENNQIGLVAFNNNTSTEYLTTDFNLVKYRINDPVPTGFLSEAISYRKTYLGAKEAFNLLSSSTNYYAEKVMIVVTDGLPDDTDNGAIASAKDSGIRVISIGINTDTTPEAVRVMENYTKSISSAPCNCFFVNKYYPNHPEETLENCNSVPAADLNAAMGIVYDTITTAIFEDLPPIVNVSKFPDGALFKTDKLNVIANASDDIGFKNFYLLWAKNTDWDNESLRQRIDSANLSVVGEDGRKHAYVSTGELGPFNEGEVINYQAVAIDGSDNVVKVDESGPKSIGVASSTLAVPNLYRNTNNKIYLNINDPSGSAYYNNDFYINISSPDVSNAINNVKMTRVDNGNTYNPQYYYDFNPGCDWSFGFIQDGSNHKYAENISVDISVKVYSSDLGQRDLVSSTDNILTSSFEGSSWVGTCSNTINDDCDYLLGGEEIIDNQELVCDTTPPSIFITRTVPDESSEVYDYTNSITLQSEAYDSDSSVIRNTIYYKKTDDSSWSTAFDCNDANYDGKCDENTSKNIANYSVDINSIFPLNPGVKVEYYSKAVDSSGNNNIGTSEIKSFIVRSGECYEKNDLEACAINTSGVCCGGVCNSSIIDSGFDISCAKEICDGTLWKRVADVSKNTLTCAKNSGETDGCFSAAPTSPLFPNSYPSTVYPNPSSDYNFNGCENRTYGCSNGYCNYSAGETTKYDGCGSGVLNYRDFECSGGACAEKYSWEDSICDSSVSFTELVALDGSNANMTGVPEVLDKKTDKIKIKASVADANQIANYKIFWQVNNGSWQEKDCGSCSSTTDAEACSCVQEIGPFVQGDFVQYYMKAEDNSPNHNIKYVGKNGGLSYKYFDGMNFETFLGSDIDANVSHSWGGNIIVNSDNVWENQADTMSMIWEGLIKPPSLGAYTIYIKTDDGIRVYLNGSSTPSVDKWLSHVATYTIDINVTSLTPIPIKINWFENGGNAVMQLGWKPYGGTEVYPIPSSNLISPYVFAVRDDACYSIDSSYSSAVTSVALANISNTCTLNSTTGICCGGYCDVTPEPSSYSEECRVNSCNGINWIYDRTNYLGDNKDGSFCGSAGTCFDYYSGCQGENKCSAGLCIADPTSIKVDKCEGNIFSDYGCSSGLCSLISTGLDCSLDSDNNGSCDCNCGGYNFKEKAYSSLKFNGTSDFVYLPNAIFTSNQSSFSAGAWIKTTSSTLMNVFGGNAGAALFMSVYNNKAAWYNGSGWFYSTVNVNDGNWHYIYYTLNSGSLYSIYVDGVLSNSISASSSSFYTYGKNISYIGRRGNATDRYFNGSIDEVRIYDRALYAEEIKDQYEGNNFSSNGLVGYWNLDDAKSGKATDSSGNNKTGYSSNTGLLGGGITSTAMPTWTTAGKFGSALSFDGGDIVNLNSLPVSTTTGSKVTVEFWMKWNGGNSQMPFGWNNYDLYFLNGYFGYNTSASDLWGVSSSGLSGRWAYITAVFNNGDAKLSELYIDGVKQNLLQKVGSTGSRSVASRAGIGGWTQNVSFRFNGLIDEVRIYNRAVSDTEAVQHYKGIFADDVNLVGYWKLDEGTGVAAYDSSINGPQWMKYYSDVTENNVPAVWKVCSDAKDNDCDGVVDKWELDCDGKAPDLSWVLKNADNEDIFGSNSLVEMKDSDIQNVGKNLTVEAVAYDDSGVSQTTIQWTTDNWNTLGGTQSCGQTDSSTCQVCIQGGSCENNSSGTISANGSNFIEDNDEDSPKFWVNDEWKNGRLQIIEGGAVTREFTIASNTLNRIFVSDWGSEGAPAVGVSYKVLKNADLIDPSTLSAETVLKIKTCAWDRSTNSNSQCTDERVVTIINSNEPPIVSNPISVDPVSFCSNGLRYRLTWNYDDSPYGVGSIDENNQFSYLIQIKRSTTTDWGSSDVVNIYKPLSVHYYDINDEDFKNSLTTDPNDYIFKIEYGSKTYDWRVKVVDDENDPYKRESDWSGVDSFTTELYRHPSVDFSVDPDCVISNAGNASTDCFFGYPIKFTSSAQVFVECGTDNDCNSTNKVQCSTSGICMACVNSDQCHDKFGNDWECNSGVCSQNTSSSCDLNSDNCLAHDMAKCDETSNLCVGCSENAQCKKFNTGATYYCNAGVCTNRSNGNCYNDGSGCVVCSDDEVCRQYNTGKDYVCNDGICENYEYRQWFFGDGSNTIPASTELNPEKIYVNSEVDNYLVTLRIKDYNGNVCEAKKNITFGGRKYPKWNEVSSGVSE